MQSFFSRRAALQALVIIARNIFKYNMLHSCCVWITIIDTTAVCATMELQRGRHVMYNQHKTMDQTKHKFYHVKLIQEGRPSYGNRICGADDAASFFQKQIGASPQEHFIAIFLNIRNIPIGWREISRGTLTSNLVHPREVYMAAIKLAAAALIVCHNHPSGVSDPSREDIEVTKRLKQAGNVLGIELLDHVIVSENSYTSLKEQGVL